MRFSFAFISIIIALAFVSPVLAQNQDQYYSEQQQQYQQNQQQTIQPTQTGAQPEPASEPLPSVPPAEKPVSQPGTIVAPAEAPTVVPAAAQETGNQSEPVLPEAMNLSLNMPKVTPIGFYIFYAALGAGLLFFFGAWWQRWRKRKKTKTLPAEDDGSVCKTCGGSGKVKEKQTKFAPCKHCKEKGIETCHHCGGTGKYGVGLVVPQSEDQVQDFMDCDYCKGTGLVKPPLPCCQCKGARKIPYEETIEVMCPTCKGSGRVGN